MTTKKELLVVKVLTSQSSSCMPLEQRFDFQRRPHSPDQINET